MVEELKSCPFCGSAPFSGWVGSNVPGMQDCGYWAIECCDVHVHAEDEEDASARWNRRTQPPARVEVKPEPGVHCTGCDGRGEVGGFVQDGYQTDPCPYCTGTGLKAFGWLIPGTRHFLEDDDKWNAIGSGGALQQEKARAFSFPVFSAEQLAAARAAAALGLGGV